MKIRKRLKRVWVTLPTLYDLQSTSDYQSLISHSVAELNAKAWAKTGHGLYAAIQQSESGHQDVKRRADTPV